MSGAFVMPGGIMADAWTQAVAQVEAMATEAQRFADWLAARKAAVNRERELRDIERLMR